MTAGKHLNEEQIQLISKLVKQGVTHEMIAKQMQLNTSTIDKYVRREKAKNVKQV